MLSHSVSHSGHEKGHLPFGRVAIYQVIYRWACLDLNQGPLPYQGSALTELSYRPVCARFGRKGVRRERLPHLMARGISRSPSA
jgi:hypothetical protein